MNGLAERFNIEKWGERHFAVYDGEELVCVTVYKRGANEVRRRLLAYELLLMEADGSLSPRQGG